MATLAGRPTSTYRLPPRAPAAGPRWRHEEQWLERPALVQFVYLSMLLHAIAILLFGAPPGGSREGRAMWGSLNVVLQGAAREAVLPRLEPPLPLPRLDRELKEPAAAARKPVALARREAPARPATAPLASPAVEAPLIVPPVMERLAPPPLRLDKALPAPRIEAIPVPVAPPIAVPAPMQPIVPDLPRVERTMAEPPTLTAPLAQPVTPPAAPPVRERVVTPPVERAPVETPVLPATPAPAPPIERAPVNVAPPQAAPAPPATPEVVRTESPAPLREEPAPRALPLRPALPVPAPADNRATDSGYDPTKPSIDLDEMRRRASRMAREGTGQRALLPFPMPAPPQRKTKTEEALEKARKPDCRTAYKELGLLAAVPLIANEFGEGTCRW